MAKVSIPAVATKVHDLLEPLEPGQRKLAISAALVMLGDTPVEEQRTPGGHSKPGAGGDGGDGHAGLPARARSWMKAEGITANELSHVFDLENGAEIIASRAPGKNAKAQTINAYVLTGISQLLQTGEMKFEDKVARQAAKNLGCFNNANHTAYMRDKGKVLSGSKAGWNLTAPGLKHGAGLVKELAQG
jgi:hypothetical protein